jgi:hypothetical protein
LLDVVVFAVAGAGAAFLLWAGSRDVEASARGWNWKSLGGGSSGSSASNAAVRGTIIMVVVTVMLATVLYLMVASLGRGS